jgi:alkaline phosphatase D
VKRREFISGIPATGGYLLLQPRLWSRSKVPSFHPFQLGIASGDPTPNSVVLWTRLVTEHLEPIGSEPVPVIWQLSTDEKMRRIIRSGTVAAEPQLAHSVHVELEGLEPDRTYWYRFVSGHAESQVGRTRTLPDPQAPVDRLRFATASCQHWELGLFNAYDHMVKDDVRFVIHLGDYIYDVARGDFRKHKNAAQPRTLEDFRSRHAQYKTDSSLQAAHAQLPFFFAIDNHDATPDRPLTPESAGLRAVAYQAWYEHMPVRRGPAESWRAHKFTRGIDFGTLARINLLDTRQFRDSEEICGNGTDPDFGFGNYRPICGDEARPDRTMLGSEQTDWLLGQFKDSPARWNVIASTVLFSPFRFQHRGAEWFYKGSWDGYPQNRAIIFNAIRDNQLRNPVILSGDLHSSWAIELPAGPERKDESPIAVEFLGPSICSSWPAPLNDPIEASLARNPHVKFYNGTERGYCLFSVTPDQWETQFRAVDNLHSHDSKTRVLATFAVNSDSPKLIRQSR